MEKAVARMVRAHRGRDERAETGEDEEANAARIERLSGEAKPVFTCLFKEYGLPKRIRTDNGVPFATNTLARVKDSPNFPSCGN